MLISSDLLFSTTVSYFRKPTDKQKRPVTLIKPLLYLLICGLILSCASSDSTRRLVRSENTDLYWYELSQFLSGLPLDEKNRFLKLSESASYKSYAKTINSYWEKIDSDYLKKVQPFKSEFMPVKGAANTAFYPLSGADFVNLNAFYPDANSNIMVGLEPAGKITDPNSLTPEQLKQGLNSIQSMVGEMAAQNYFTRKRMRREFANPHFSGTSPVLLIFMTRLGLKIDFWERVELDRTGKLIPETEAHIADKNPDKIEAVRIYFHKEKDMYSRELTFFRMYINENSAEENTAEGKYFVSQGRLNLLLKSAEYVLQLPMYEKFIKTILARTDTVVQDDSAIPFKAFDRVAWEAKVFGVYTARARLQNTPNVPDQTDLQNEFKQNAKNLPFKYGYGVLKGNDKSNLMVLIRKQ
ncbi:MAG: hypothetical protein KBF99_04645 [Leptospiraceae bacterium]|nr:hypothetical protein [Leptospiraceae bacterium]MBL0264449.1 hypothetical protein [Leptospiraceae bacterium]MBP9162445.1 hypothetical protein [Leptospiraceae bacterium]